MPVVRTIQTGDGAGMAEVAPDCYTFASARELRAAEWVKAPQPPYALPDVRPGTKLRVLASFVTDARCPLGTGKQARLLERDYVIVYAGSGSGVAWMKVPGGSGGAAPR